MSRRTMHRRTVARINGRTTLQAKGILKVIDD